MIFYDFSIDAIAIVLACCGYMCIFSTQHNSFVLLLSFQHHVELVSVLFVVLLSFGALKCASKSKFNNERIHNKQCETRIRIRIERLMNCSFNKTCVSGCRWFVLLLLLHVRIHSCTCALLHQSLEHVMT